jgi:hypothetical protein
VACGGRRQPFEDTGAEGEGGEADECETAFERLLSKGGEAYASQQRFKKSLQKVTDKYKLRAEFDAIYQEFENTRNAARNSGQVDTVAFDGIGRRIVQLLIKSGHRNLGGDIGDLAAEANFMSDKFKVAKQASDAARKACQEREDYEARFEKSIRTFDIDEAAQQAFIDGFISAANAFIGQ